MPTPALMSNPFAPAAASANGARLVAADGRELLLRAAHLHVYARGGICRVELRQRWTNPYAEPLQVDYLLPLPADAAVSGYDFQVGERTTVATIAKKQRARQLFDEAVAEGHTAALLDQARSSLFTQSIGNIPAGEAITIRVTLDQPLTWRERGWEWRFPTVVAPRYMGGPGRTPDAGAVTVEIVPAPVPAEVGLDLRIGDAIVGGFPSSPSHAIEGRPDAVTLGEGATLDRDIVVRWPVAELEPGVALRTHLRDGDVRRGYGLLTIVPPRGPRPAHGRDVCVLLDVSGSMAGEPIAQAKRVVRALVDSMAETDRLEMIAFSWRTDRWKRAPQTMTRRGRAKALAWLEGLSAGGGTEMREGILAALRPLRDDAQRQVLLVTDGLIGFESEIVGEIRRRLPRQSRVHTLGVGHGVNRSLTGPAARAGGGVELIVAPGEDVEPVVATLLARTVAPQLVDVHIDGDAVLDRAPARTADLFAGAPVRVALELRPEGGTIHVRGTATDGAWTQTIEVPPLSANRSDGDGGGEEVAALFARERVEDLETARASGEPTTTIDPQIEAIGLAFAISTRETSWIAVDDSSRVDLQSPTRHVSVPHTLTAGMSAQGVGLRPPAPFAAAAPSALAGGGFGGGPPMAAPAGPAPRVRSRKRSRPRRQRAELDQSRRGRGALDHDDEGLGEGFGETADEFADELTPVAASGGAALAATTVAKVLLERDGELIVHIVLAQPLDWDPSRGVELLDEDGQSIPATLDPARSTVAGSLPAGMVVRLTLAVEDIDVAEAHTLRVCGLELELAR